MTMPPPYQPPVAPRRSSALPWVIVAVVAVLVVGGLVALFALRGTGGGTPTPTPSPSPSATTGTSTAPADWLTEDQYPSEVKGWTMRWDDGLPDYTSPDGSTILLVLDWGPIIRSLEEDVELSVPGETTQPLPGIYCYDMPDQYGAPYRLCAGATASNRIVSAGTPMVRMPDDELAAWTQELLDGITG